MQLVRDINRARFGTKVDVAPKPDEVKGVSPSSSKQPKSPFSESLPQFVVERAYFHGIATPVTTAWTNEGWYGLRSIRPKDFGAEFAFAGCAMTLLPSDSDGGALTGFATTPIGWGDTRGLGAAIVVGKNLGITQGAWTDKPAYIPGIDFGDASPNANGLVTPTGSFHKYLVIQGFPTGKFRDTAPNKPPFRWSFAPHLHRFAGADSLDVALVVRGSIINNIAAGTIVGLAEIDLTIGRVDSDRDFTPRG